MMRLFYFIRYLVIFARELVKANIEVAKLALSPRAKFKPGFLAVPIRCNTDFEITSLGNSITLTPGTITVHIERDRGLLIIHALHIGDDPDAVRAGITTALEENILRWARAGHVPSGPSQLPQGGTT